MCHKQGVAIDTLETWRPGDLISGKAGPDLERKTWSAGQTLAIYKSGRPDQLDLEFADGGNGGAGSIDSSISRSPLPAGS